MNYEYRKNAEAYKKFNARELFGLPADVELLFNNIYVRVYKSHEHDGYFSCSLAVPNSQDDDGYVLEFEFNSASLDDELDSLDEEVGSSFELVTVH